MQWIFCIVEMLVVFASYLVTVILRDWLLDLGKQYEVIGIGERKTPNPFIVACDKFIYTEILKRL